MLMLNCMVFIAICMAIGMLNCVGYMCAALNTDHIKIIVDFDF